MSSSNGRRGRAQTGQSIVEAAVAAAVLGIGVVTGLTALDTAIGGSKQATHQAWATCAVRAQAAAIEEAPWHPSADYLAMTNMSVTKDPSSTGTGAGELQVLNLLAKDPATSAPLASATVYKARALSSPKDGADPPPSVFEPWCTYLLRSGS
jgi:Tfp pilus assembly protein PilV